MGLSAREYSLHRKRLGLPGQTHVAVLKAAKKGRIPREPDGTFDPAKCDPAWSRNTMKRDAQCSPVERSIANELQLAKLRKMVADSEFAKLKVQKATGDLLERDRVETIFHEYFRRIRDVFLSLPARSAPMIAESLALNDSKQLTFEIDKVIREALSEIIKG